MGNTARSRSFRIPEETWAKIRKKNLDINAIVKNALKDAAGSDSCPVCGQELKALGAAGGKPRKPKKADPAPKLDNAQAWDYYATAYKTRYGVSPIRNAKINSQIAMAVKRLGADASQVLSYYAGLNDAFYIRCGHSLDVFLRDCEKLHTLWKTGKRPLSQKNLEMAHIYDQLERVEKGEL